MQRDRRRVLAYLAAEIERQKGVNGPGGGEKVVQETLKRHQRVIFNAQLRRVACRGREARSAQLPQHGRLGRGVRQREEPGAARAYNLRARRPSHGSRSCSRLMGGGDRGAERAGLAQTAIPTMGCGSRSASGAIVAARAASVDVKVQEMLQGVAGKVSGIGPGDRGAARRCREGRAPPQGRATDHAAAVVTRCSRRWSLREAQTRSRPSSTTIWPLPSYREMLFVPSLLNTRSGSGKCAFVMICCLSPMADPERRMIWSARARRSPHPPRRWWPPRQHRPRRLARQRCRHRSDLPAGAPRGSRSIRRLLTCLETAAGRPWICRDEQRAAGFLHRILRDGVLLAEPDPTRRVFEVKARNEYFDLVPVGARYRRACLETL